MGERNGRGSEEPRPFCHQARMAEYGQRTCARFGLAMTTRARSLVAAMRAFVLGLGAASLWLGRDGINPDGVAYLDVSDAYLSGEWASRTGYWSPFYPMLLALARLVGGTAPARELLVAQALNFVVFLATFVGFELLVRSLRNAPADGRPASSPNDTAWLVLAYTLFAVATVGWIRTWLVTPDMLVTAIVFFVAAAAVRLTSGPGGWAAAAAVGVLLGLGYLTKAALLPVGIVILATLAIVLRKQHAHRWGLKVALASAVFAAIAAPQIAYVSKLSGRITFSDVGRIQYLWFIADVPGAASGAFALPADLPRPTGTKHTLTPLDPSRDAGPVVYDIDAPIPGTLPVWYDAGYWYRDVVAPLYPLRIVRAVVRHARVFLEVLGFLIVGGLAAALATRPSWRDALAMRPAWILVVPALAAIAMYGLVLVQTRYIAPFVLVLILGLVPPWAMDDLSRRLGTGFAVGALAALPLVVHQVKVDTTFWRGSADVRATLVAALAARGVGPGARLGYIGEAYEAYWARPGRMRFVTLIPRGEAPRFWQLGEAGRASVIDRMMRARTDAIIAEAPSPGVSTAGWEPLPAAGKASPPLLLYRVVRGVARR
jgi:hypothetical protein